jgi:tetratricopeptide (TPR) repeat protein
MALGVLCGERGDLAERRLWLHHARRLEKASGDPPSLRLLLNLQVDALEHNEPEQALAYGEEALALAPEDGEVLFQQGRVLLEQGRREEAQPHLDRALELLKARVANEPEDLKAWRLLASCELNAEHIDSSIEAHAQALALDPNHLPSLQAISRMLINRVSDLRARKKGFQQEFAQSLLADGKDLSSSLI